MKTHWKKMFNTDYLGSWDLEQEQDRIVTITKVDKTMVKSAQNPKGEECPVIHFAEFEKPMVLNVTNCKTIEKMFGPMIEDWPKQRVTLFVKKRVKAFGDYVDALRVRPTSPQKPELKPGSKKWDGARQAIAEGNTTIEAIEGVYLLTEENKLKLCSK